ncbi:hypothetical protein D210916BOD24_08060 [Alteromonas sp. D210916BOD_24]
MGDHIEPVAKGITFLSRHTFAQQLWQDGSIRWLYLEGLVEPDTVPISHDIPISLRKSASALSQRMPPVVDTPENFVIRLHTDASVTINKKAFLDLDFGSLQCQLYLHELAEGVRVTDNHYELMSDEATYQQVKLIQAGSLTFKNGKQLLLQAEYTVQLCDGTVLGRVTLTNPAAASHPSGKWDLGDPNSIYLKECGLRLQGHKSTTMLLDKTPFTLQGCRTLSVFQASSGHELWDSPVHVNAQNRVSHTFKGYVVTRENEQVASGNHCNPTLRVHDQSGEFFIKTNQFWQNFPSSITATAKHSEYSLLGARYAEAIELQPGEQKTREFSIAAVPTGKATLSFSAQWIDNTQVLPFFTNVPSVFQPLIDKGIDGAHSFFNKRRDIDEFGWRHFGELYADHESALRDNQSDDKSPFVSHYNNQYDPIYGMLLQWLISGDQRWFELADDLAKHVADIDVYHTQLDKPEYSGGLFWHTDHYVQAYTATHRTYSKRQPCHVYDDHAGGGGPGGQHCYTNGLTLHYLLTGYTPSKNAVSSLVNWIERYYEGDGTLLGALLAFKNSATPGLKNIKTGQYPLDRGTGNYLQALLDRFVLFGQLKDIRLAGHVIKHTISPNDNISERDLTDIENTWFYTVFLQSLCRFIHTKTQLEQLDDDYHYAVAGLIHYAKWMQDNEYPYLDKPDILEFPNQTWSGQDLRKLCVLHFASAFLDEHSRKQSATKMDEIASNVLHRLVHSEEASNTRILCLLMQNANYHGYTAHDGNPQTLVPLEKFKEASPESTYSLSRHLFSLLQSFSLKRERSQLIKRFPTCQNWLGKP